MKRDTKRTSVFTRRALLMMGGQAAILGGLGVRLYQVQVQEGDRYATLADGNRISARMIAAPRGRILYSTCSLEPEEDDAPIEAFLAAHPEWSLEPPPEGTVPASTLDAGRLRVLPHRHATDGSFAARLRRGVA